MAEREFLTMPPRWEPTRDEPSWTTGSMIQMLVSTRDYTGRVEPEWIPFDRISPGDAAVYPFKGEIPDRGQGQWKSSEVLGWRVDMRLLDPLRETVRNRSKLPDYLYAALTAYDPISYPQRLAGYGDPTGRRRVEVNERVEVVDG